MLAIISFIVTIILVSNISSFCIFPLPMEIPSLVCFYPQLLLFFSFLCPFPGGSLVTKLCLTLATPWTVAWQDPLSLQFSRQEYQSGLLFLSPEDLPDPEIEPRSPALQAYSLPAELQGKPLILVHVVCTNVCMWI